MLMCGIAGIMCLKREGGNIEENHILIKKMTDIMIHRGPDGEGQMCLDEGNVFMGHRRLSIIDLSEAAKQPMQSIDKRFTITYNGEIYNYKEIRDELEQIGYHFFSSSDTEVVMNAYAEWGDKVLTKFNGIYAFAIWDNYKKELIMVRDRYGAKPLYYTKIGGQLVFASEYKAILLHPDFQKHLNLYVLKEYFTFQNIFSNQTFFQNIKILEPGSYIKINYEKEDIPNSVQYWDYKFYESNEKISKEEYEEELNRLLIQAVNRQMISDVEIGSYLSGGIDSGAITSIASKHSGNLKTFTCGFDLNSVSGLEMSYDEREKAEYMSYLYKTEHYEMVLKAGDMERCMDKLVWHLEDPRVGQSYPNFYAAKLASNFVKVVLAGTGGDELFAGYPWRYYKVSDATSYEKYIDEYYLYWQRLLKEDEVKGFLAPVYSEIKDYSTKDVFKTVLDGDSNKRVSPKDNLNHSLYLEAKTFLNGLLIVEDKLSMAHSLECRVPFLDKDLIDFAMKLPCCYKLRNINKSLRMDENINDIKTDKYYRDYGDGKLILRSMLKRYLPEDITTGRKQGFVAPDASWFKGDSIDYIKEIVYNSNSKIYSFVDKTTTREIVKKHFEGVENRRLFIWSIINFEKWLCLFL